MAGPEPHTVEVHSVPWRQHTVSNKRLPCQAPGSRREAIAIRSYVWSHWCQVLRSESLGLDCQSVYSPRTASSKPEMNSLVVSMHSVSAPGWTDWAPMASKKI